MVEIYMAFTAKIHMPGKSTDLPQVIKLLGIKPPDTHLVLTGQDAHPDGARHKVTDVQEVNIPVTRLLNP